MKKWWLIILIVFFSLSFVNAYSKDKSIEWLNSAMNWPSDSIEEISFSLLALASNNYDVTVARNVLNQKVTNVGGSFDNIKDTALAALALDYFNDDTTSLLGSIETGLTKANIGYWFIQITTSGEGTCTLTYKETSKDVIVNGNEKLEVDGKKEDWINVETYLGQIVEPIETVNVDCSDVLDSSMIISLLRIPPGNEFFIIDERLGNNVVLEINNACYSPSIGGSCDLDTTFYASWVLNRLGEDLKTLPYLEDNANTNLYYAMLGSIIGSQNKYTDLLITNQEDSGGWENDVITTSFAISTLKEQYTYRSNVDNATAWLEQQQIVTNQENNGSFGSKLETAAALYLALTDISTDDGGDGVTGYCSDGFIDAGEECDDFNLENNDGCSSICLIESGWQCTGEPSLCTQETCESDLDCAFGYVCDTTISTCVPEELPTSCDSRYRCPVPSDYECVSGICRPLTIPTSCTYYWECPDNYDCVGSICQVSEAGQRCDFDYQCAEGEYCDTLIGECRQKEDEDCGDGFCDFDEDSISCPQDCQPTPTEYCGDDICQPDEDAEFCPEDCAEEKGFPFWIIWLLIIVIILVGGGYFFYSKYLKKPKTSTKPSYLGPEKPKPGKPTKAAPTRRAPRISVRESTIERELDKSIREAQKLLRKKK